jgi:hypothetical protein
VEGTRNDALVFGEDIDNVDGDRIDGPVLVTHRHSLHNGAAVCRKVKSVVVLRHKRARGERGGGGVGRRGGGEEREREKREAA